MTSHVEASAPVSARDRRFLVIKAWGNGFWSDISHVMGSLLLAEIAGRIPVTHWGTRSLFGFDGNRDAFTAYFAPLSAVTVEDLASLEGSDFFPAKWTNANLLADNGPRWGGDDPGRLAEYYLGHPERIAVADWYLGVIDVMEWLPESHESCGQPVVEVYRRLVDKYLHPRSHIVADVEAFYQRHIAGTPTIAVHVRGLDKKTEAPDLAHINPLYFDSLDREDPSWRIFLLTDDAYWADAFCERYGDRVIMTDSRRGTGDTGIHYSSAAPDDRAKLGHEVIRDTYLALQCDKFLGNGHSNLSSMVEILKRWDPGTCTLLVPSQLYERNLSISITNRPLAVPVQAPGKEPRYRLGEEIDFSTPDRSRRFMRSGWSINESWGAWTRGSPAELSLVPEAKPDQPLILRALVRPFLTEAHNRLSVRIAACGEEIAEWTFVLQDAANPNWRLATIPPRADSDSVRPLLISFAVDIPQSPMALGISEDWRRLGLGFSTLSISAAGPIHDEAWQEGLRRIGSRAMSRVMAVLPFLKRHRKVIESRAEAVDTSQSGEVALLKSLAAEFLCDPFIVDVGAHDGISLSHSRGLILAGWRAVLIEPVPALFAKLERTYRGHDNVACLNVACAEAPGVRRLFFGTDGDNGFLSTLCTDENEWFKSARSDRFIEVRADTLKNLLSEAHVPKRFGILSVDTEGMDYEVLCGLDFSAFTPTIIVTEEYDWNPKKPLRSTRCFPTAVMFSSKKSARILYGLHGRPDDLRRTTISAMRLTSATRRSRAALCGEDGP
jgi:FkbM family methyltransferase